MKALITAFALLSFVAASTVPVTAQAETTTHHVTHKKASKKRHVAQNTKKIHKSHKRKSTPSKSAG